MKPKMSPDLLIWCELFGAAAIYFGGPAVGDMFVVCCRFSIV
jgi:hypothetical protein